MSDMVKVTPAQIDTARGNIKSTSGKIDSDLQDLKSGLAPMIETWSGQAREAYYEKQRQWDQAAAELNQVLHQISVALGSINDNYMAGERSATNMFGG